MEYKFIIDEQEYDDYLDKYIAIIRRFSKNTDQPLKFPAHFVRIDEKRGQPALSLKVGERFFLCPDLTGKTRQFIYMSGMPGSGKTWWAKNYIKIYHKLFPDRKIYYFSRKMNETDVKDIPFAKFLQIENFDEIMKEYNGNDMIFKDTLVVFDDIVADDKLQKRIWGFIDQTSELYRKINCSVISCNHTSSDYKKTIKVIAQCDHYVFFPHSLKERSNRVLSYYFKLKQSIIDKIMDTKSRWVCIDTLKSIVTTENEMYNIST